MKMLKYLVDESGFTLLETVVATSLFVGVLIPLGAAVGTLMLSNRSDMLHQALRIAEGEMCSVVPQNEISGRGDTINGGVVVQKDVRMDGNLVLVNVSVASVKNRDKCLVALQKTFLVQR